MFPSNKYDQMIKVHQDNRSSLAKILPGSNMIDKHPSCSLVVKLQGLSSRATAIPECLGVTSANSIKVVPVKVLGINVEQSTSTPQKNPGEGSIRQQEPTISAALQATSIDTLPSSKTFSPSEALSVTPTTNIASSLSNSEAIHPQLFEQGHRGIHFAESHARNAELATSSTNCELQDINTLASSQPISLGSLVSIAIAKNKSLKGAKGSKAELSEESTDNMEIRYGNSRATQPITRMSTAVGAVSTTHPLRNMTRVGAEDGYTDIIQSPYYFAPQDVQDMGEQAYSVDIGQVSYAHPGFGQSMPNQASKMAYSAFAAPLPQGRPRLMGPEDVSPTKQEEKFALQELQYNMEARNSHHEGVYRSTLTNHSIGQVNNPLHVRVPPGFEDIQGTTSTQNYIGFPTTIRTQHEADEHDFGLTNFGTATNSQFSQMSCNMPHYESPQRNLGDQKYASNMSTTSPMGNGTYTPAGRMLRPRSEWNEKRNESIRAEQAIENRILENAVGKAQGANPYTATTALHDPFLIPTDQISDNNRALAQGFSASMWDVVNTRQVPIDPSWPSMNLNTQNETHACPSEEQSLFSTTQTPGYPFGRYIGGQFSSGPDMVYRPVPWPVTPAKNGSKSASTEGTKFPPPGLSHPTTPPEDINNPDEDEDANPNSPANKDLPETLTWFHSDHRGEEDLRKRIEDIALEDRENRERSRVPAINGVDPETVEASTVLMGHALANIQSYLVGDRKNQAANFANFGPVRDEYCEPTHDGNRSYYDTSPPTNPWPSPPSHSTRYRLADLRK